MKTKVNDWYNPETDEVLYGIDVWHSGEWCHAAEGGKPLLFKTAAERDAKRKEVRRWTGGGLVKTQGKGGPLVRVSEPG